MAEAPARFERRTPLVHVQVRTADVGGRDLDEDVAGVLDLRVRHVLDRHRTRSFVYRGLHDRSLTSPAVLPTGRRTSGHCRPCRVPTRVSDETGQEDRDLARGVRKLRPGTALRRSSSPLRPAAGEAGAVRPDQAVARGVNRGCPGRWPVQRRGEGGDGTSGDGQALGSACRCGHVPDLETTSSPWQARAA